jgi:hypothetical protein
VVVAITLCFRVGAVGFDRFFSGIIAQAQRTLLGGNPYLVVKVQNFEQSPSVSMADVAQGNYQLRTLFLAPGHVGADNAPSWRSTIILKL